VNTHEGWVHVPEERDNCEHWRDGSEEYGNIEDGAVLVVKREDGSQDPYVLCTMYGMEFPLCELQAVVLLQGPPAEAKACYNAKAAEAEREAKGG